jgi:nucleoside-diphosphate-sugar epimerase
MEEIPMKIILTGGAGLVGQNLIARLKSKGYQQIIVLDKHAKNLLVLKQMHPELTTEEVDLSIQGNWQQYFSDADAVIMLHAQIGGNDYSQFVRNNIDATQHVLAAMKKNSYPPRLIHVSSSVVQSIANDFYTNTKTQQEKIVAASDLPYIILRPTLMFGWFDRKHLGWLARFMQKTPLFPIPGNGCYLRQPLYVGDFCQIIIRCLENNMTNTIYDISGQEKINYIDIIRLIKKTLCVKTKIVKIPYHLFYCLLFLWGLFDKNPPFTTQQLTALSTKEEFPVIDWPRIFDVTQTSFAAAIDETFNDPIYSKIALDF